MYYARRLAVVLSLSYLAIFAVAVPWGRFSAHDTAYKMLRTVSGPAQRVANVAFDIASRGDGCAGLWHHESVSPFAYVVFAFAGWLEYFAVGFAGGLLCAGLQSAADFIRRYIARVPVNAGKLARADTDQG